MTLIDRWLPTFDVVERHAAVVHAPADRAYAALRATDFSRSRLIRCLLAFRAAPIALASPRAASSRIRARLRASGLTLDAISHHGFALLEEEPGRELVIGLVGRFWTPAGDLRPTDAARFREPLPAGLAQAAWSFHVEPLGADRARLSTETRVRCADARARARFRLYWFLVRPGSGLIRRAMLRAIRRTAEASGGR